LKDLPLNELAEHLENKSPGGVSHARVIAELTRRQTLAQIEAAEATKATAEHNKRNANYMLASVVVLMFASIAQLVVTWLTRAH
jgi:hypothetical protein